MASKRQLVFVISSKSYLRIMQNLSLAVVAAAMGINVEIYFTYGGILRLVKGCEDTVYDDDYMADDIKRGMERGSIPRISNLLETLSILKVKIYACPSAMAFHNIRKDDLNNCVTGVKSISDSVKTLLDYENSNIIYV